MPPKPMPPLEVGDTIVSKFGNIWHIEAWDTRRDGERCFVLRNRPDEVPDAKGTVYSGPLPEWARHALRNGESI